MKDRTGFGHEGEDRHHSDHHHHHHSAGFPGSLRELFVPHTHDTADSVDDALAASFPRGSGR